MDVMDKKYLIDRENKDQALLDTIQNRVSNKEFDLILSIIRSFDHTCLYRVVNTPQGQPVYFYCLNNGYVHIKESKMKYDYQRHGEIFIPLSKDEIFHFHYQIRLHPQQ